MVAVTLKGTLNGVLKIKMTFDKNTSDTDIKIHLLSEGWSDKRIMSFIRGWNAVKNS